MELSGKRPTVPKIRGLPATRRGALMLALACAGAAAVLLLVALGHYRQSVALGNRQDTVLVATGTIQKGTSGNVIAAQQLYKPTPILAKNLAAGAITNAATLHGEVALHDILPGQQLTASDFSTAAGGIVGQLTPDQRAVSLSLDAAHGLIGELSTGDRVDVYGDFTLDSSDFSVAGAQGGAPVTSSGSSGKPVVKLLTANALVLKAPSSSGSLGSGSGSGPVVLAVPVSQVPRLAFAAENGKVWLALRPGDAKTPSQGLTSLDSEVFGIQPVVHFSNGTAVISGRGSGG